jgi:hypothetical protein
MISDHPVPWYVNATNSECGTTLPSFMQHVDKFVQFLTSKCWLAHPRPYTHLTQFFLVAWVYTLPLCLVPTYKLGAHVFMSFFAVILFGMDSVATEIQDPFGFDNNDLNVQGYETKLFHNINAIIDGPLMVYTRDFAASTTHARDMSSRKGRLGEHKSGASELMGVEELEAGLHLKENLWSLAAQPWKIHGSFEEQKHSKESSRKDSARERVEKQRVLSEQFHAENVLHKVGESEEAEHDMYGNDSDEEGGRGGITDVKSAAATFESDVK